ncbi:MAG: tetratricopeptide repeat protein [Saprospiraceae bacterium]|nr:tetratricopeptide repeat protein [Saprospiraceae bacterium]
MIRKNLRQLLVAVALISYSGLHSQVSLYTTDHSFFFPQGEDYFDSAMFGLSLQAYEADAALTADGNAALSSYNIDETRSIDLMLERIALSNNPGEISSLYKTIAQYYFLNKDYRTARSYYEGLNADWLSTSEKEFVDFRIGYCHITEKRFTDALTYFNKARNYNGPHYIDAAYYSGICNYFMNNKEAAIDAFEEVQNATRYRKLIPYYLAQIYFKDGAYDDAIVYAKRKLESGSANASAMHKILGLSYLAKSDYTNALIHLDAYAKQANKLTENEFYQIAITHYNLGQYDESIPFFKELSYQASEIGQVSNYLLGSIYLNKDEQRNAQGAFKQAFKYSFFDDIKSESEFLYYKISAQLGEERAALTGLSQIKPEHPNYSEAQDLLSELILRTKDYAMAIQVIDGMAEKSPKILNSYKTITYDYGILFLTDNNFHSALSYLTISKDVPGDEALDNETSFWLAYGHDQVEDETKSRKALEEYLASGDNTYRFKAMYMQAYNEIEDKEFNNAKATLETSLDVYNIDTDDKALFDDVAVRLADLELLDNNYETAIEYYDLAIENGAAESDYILYQKAIIYGVNNQVLDKLTSLESLIKDYPESSYRDDALFEIGESLLDLKKNNEAYRVYKSLVEEFGDDSEYAPLSYLRQGLISYNQGDIDAALLNYKRCLNLTDNAEQKRQALLAIEEIYVNDIGDPAAYFDFAENVAGFKIDAFKKDSISYYQGFNAYSESKFEAAVSLLGNYLESYDNGFYREEAHYYKAESYVLLKNYKDAFYHYEQLIKNKESQFYNGSLKKAALIAFNYLKDFERSYQLFNAWTGLESELDIEVYESALYSAFVIGAEEGIIKYGEYIANAPEASAQSKATAYFNMGKLFERKEEYEIAIEQFNKVIELSGNSQSAEASFSISRIYFNEEKYDLAEEQAFETTQHASNYPFWVAKSLILIGDIYTIKEDYLNASAAYESVIENFTENPELINAAKTQLEKLNQKIEGSSRIKQDEGIELIQKDSIK